MKSEIELPDSTRKRLVQLLQLLKSWPNRKITSVAISESTGWKPSLIRHDLWLIGFNKGVSNGYLVLELINSINHVLKLENFDTSNTTNSNGAADSFNKTDSAGVFKNICITGLGRIGAALLDQNLVDDSIFQIKAGFDSNVNRVEILRSTFPLYPTSEMNFVVKRDKIEYAILAVADKDAQLMADRLVKAGIKGIVNMTNIVITVPEGVKVENLSIMNALKLVI